jgi:uncharacterized membrane protein YbhN (UPF0104 family)
VLWRRRKGKRRHPTKGEQVDNPKTKSERLQAHKRLASQRSRRRSRLLRVKTPSVLKVCLLSVYFSFLNSVSVCCVGVSATTGVFFFFFIVVVPVTLNVARLDEKEKASDETDKGVQAEGEMEHRFDHSWAHKGIF